MGMCIVQASSPMYILKIKLVLHNQSGTAITIRAAIRTTVPLPLDFSTLRTTFGLLGEAFRCEEFLFPNSEREGSSTIETLDRFL